MENKATEHEAGQAGGNVLTRWCVAAVLVLLLILGPFFIWEESLAGWGRGLLESGSSRWAIGSVLAALLAGDLILPIPSSLLSTAAGSLLGLWPGALVTWTGMTVGCWIGYGLGTGPGRAATRRFVGEQEIDRVTGLHARIGDWIIVVSRSVPVLAEASVIFAGVAGMPARRFFLMAGLSNAGIAITYAAVGAYAIEAESFLLAFAGAIGLPGLGLLLLRLRRWFNA